MSFITPELLYCLLFLPLITWWLYKRNSLYEARCKILQVQPKNRRNNLRLVGTTLSLVFFIIALARPYYGYQEFTTNNRGRDRYIVLDISLSMLSADLSPSRLEFARRKILDLTQLIEDSGSGDRLGLVLFSGDAYLYCPLTEDYATFRTFVRSVTVDFISSKGSDFSEAFKVMEEVTTENAYKPQIILLSDGGDEMSGNILDSFKIDTIGIGTSDGAPISLSSGYLKDSSGEIVITKLNEENLINISKVSGGTYKKTSLDDSDIIALLSDSTSEVGGQEKKLRLYNELGPIFVFIGLAVILIIDLLSLRKIFFLGLFTVIILNTNFAHATPSAYQAYQSYKKHDYESAKNKFSELNNISQNNNPVLEGLAASQFKSSDFEQAEKSYNKLVERYSNSEGKFRALYNLGNSQFSQKKYKEAITSYEKALEIRADKNTEFNRDLAKQLLIEEEQKKQEQQDKNKNDTDSDDKKNQNEPQDSNSPNPSPSPSDSQKKDENSEQDQGQDADGKNQKDSPEQQETKNKNDLDKEDLQDPVKLNEKRSKSWLDSLPDSPVLLMKKNSSDNSKEEQIW